MTGETWAVLGILVTLIVGIPALFIGKKAKSNKQRQKVRDQGTGYQAGRDINLGDGE